MFHGNAGNIGHRVPIAKVLEETLGCNVMLLEYRGYGLSSGSPDESGLKVDAQTGVDYIRERASLKDTKIIIHGQSLGGAVAIDLVAKNQYSGDIAGLILENTFLSIRKLIPTYVCHWPYSLALLHMANCLGSFLLRDISPASVTSTGSARTFFPRSLISRFYS